MGGDAGGAEGVDSDVGAEEGEEKVEVRQVDRGVGLEGEC